MTEDSIFEEIEKEAKKLSVKDDPHYLDVPRITPEARKEIFRRIMEPRLFARIRKGKKYYFYTDGKTETYLGTADLIRRCVLFHKEIEAYLKMKRSKRDGGI